MRWFLNYANPMAINTWAALDYGNVRTLGLCHGVQHGAAQIADALGAERRQDLEYVCAGINHQTWFIDLRLKGRRIGRDELLAAFERHPVFSKQEKVRIDVLQALRRVFDREQRPSVGVSALVPQAAR